MTPWKAAVAAGTMTLTVASANVASASSSEFLCYTSPAAEICFEWNGPFDYACRSILGMANTQLPLFLGLEREAALQGRHFSVRDGSFRQLISIDGNPVDLAGRRESSELVKVLADALGCEAVPRYSVPVFTIQLELLPPHADATPHVKAWELRIPSMADDRGLLSHAGDCDLPVLWTHMYARGRTGVRYGVFETFPSAWQGVAALQLEGYEPQIIKTLFRADSLNNYFVNIEVIK